jgi:hypothetical protein
VVALEMKTVNLRIYFWLYFWLNGREYSWMWVRSSMIRLVKLVLHQQGFSIPSGDVLESTVPQEIKKTAGRTETKWNQLIMLMKFDPIARAVSMAG